MPFSLFKRQDWYLNGAVFTLIGCGLLMLFSISNQLFRQQLGWTVLAVILIFLFAHIDWRSITTYRWMIIAVYLTAIVLLVATYFFAPTIRNTRSWLVFGPVQFQTSEFVKLAMIIFFAYYFARRHIGIAHVKNIALSLLYFAVPAAFVFFQPDLGTVIVLTGIWVGFLLVSGLRPKHLAIGLVIVGLVGFFGWNTVLQDYQRDRIIGIFQPASDPLGVNYSTIQSKIAIGSGGWFGKGFGQGTQVQLGFLPEAGTDFIFSAFIEEWGFVGGLVVITAFILMIFRTIKIGLEAENNFYRFVSLGAVTMFLIQFTINTGAAVGLLPVIGITFPFFSYGGSSLLINAIIIGIIQSATVHRSLK